MTEFTKRAWALCLALIALPALPAPVQFLGAPERLKEAPAAFAHRLANVYAPGGRWWKEVSPKADDAYRAKVAGEFYDPVFDKLMNENTTLAMKHGGGVDLDYDPVCQCQDDAGPLQVGAVRQTAPDAAELHMKSWCETKGAECRGYLILIRRTGGGWRVYDVVDQGGSVRAMLVRHNACLRTSHNDATAAKCLS